jgi:DNA-binding transcriptional LysR family regulator
MHKEILFMDINFELYKVFYYTAKYLSFSEAATYLFISQSAVSQSIKTLEEKLDTKLFLRSTKQVRLTPAGALLFQHVEQAFVFFKTGERSIHELHTLDRGELCIGASDTICKYYLLPYLELFIRKYPKIKLKVVNRPSPICAELLQKGLVDISVINLPAKNLYPNVTISRQKQLHDVFVAGPRFSHLSNQNLTLTQVSQLPLLTLEPNTTTREFLDNLFREAGLAIQPEIELGSLDLLIQLAKIGAGISFISREYIATELQAQTLFALPIQSSIPPRQLGIITHNSLPISPAAEKFIELL